MARQRRGAWRSRRANMVLTVLVVLAVLIATVARVVLAFNTPVSPSTDADLDDRMLMNYANYIRVGKWVGPYGVHTLAKNAGYSLCMAAFKLLGMPYQLGFVLLLVLVCAIAAQSLEPLVPSLGIRCSLYMAMLYMPAFFSSYFFARVYRNGMAIVFALLVFSSFVGLYLRRRRRPRAMLGWALLAGLSLGFFSIIQESAAWVLPFVLACSLVTFVLVIADGASLRKRVLQKRQKKNLGQPRRLGRSVARVVVPRLVIVALPLLVFAGVVGGVCAINQSHYGVSLLNDKYQGEFARATADLMRIDVGYEDNRVWVSNDALAAALKESPSLRGMKKEIRKYWKICQDISSEFNVLDPKDEPQVLGDHSYWALRSAYYEHGGYKNAVKTERYWATVANELEDAFASGALKSKEGLFLSATTEPMPWDRVTDWLVSSVEVVGRYAWGDLMRETMIRPLPRTEVGTGSLEDELKARKLLGENTVFSVDGKLYEDRVLEAARPWLVAANAVGNTTLLAHRVLLCACGAGLVVLLVRDVRKKSVLGVRTALILAGLYLSALVLVFGASWMISFLSSNESAVAASSNAFSYCGAVYALVSFAECVVLGRVLNL